MRTDSRGFTLIELLIVVAIIGILAAIAIPNFLEAQTRSKVASVKANFTTLATGLECYYVDNDKYVLAADDLGWRHPAERLSCLTTPVPYLQAFPYDVFETDENSWSYWEGYYWYEDRWSINDADWIGTPHWGHNAPHLYYNWLAIQYEIISKGPDRRDSFWSDGDGTSNKHLKEYDPSNGTTSWGDLHYFGPGNINPGLVVNY